MADTTSNTDTINFSNTKQSAPLDVFAAGKPKSTSNDAGEDPAAALANARHEFGEHGGVNFSIEPSVTFTVMEPDDLRRINSGELGPDEGFYIYPASARSGPLHGGSGGHRGRLLHGLGHVGHLLCAAPAVQRGDHVVAPHTLYGSSQALLEGWTKLLYFEAMSNPSLTVVNLPELCRIAHDKGVTVVVDNTFAPMVVSAPTSSFTASPSLSAAAQI